MLTALKAKYFDECHFEMTSKQDQQNR